MLFSKEVLLNIEPEATFYNLEDLFFLSDCEDNLNNEDCHENKACLLKVNQGDARKIKQKDLKCILLVAPETIKHLPKPLLDKNSIIATNNPAKLFEAVLEILHDNSLVPEVHLTAIVHPDAKIGENVSIGAYSTIAEDSTIGNNCIIHEHCSIGKHATIGNNTIFHSGAKIGFNVFGFKRNPEGVWAKYQQIAGVKIGNNVTIGSNTCINNGFAKDTIINDNAFIDSLCQIGEEVIINSGTIVAASCFIAANTKVGKNCWISPNVSIRENLTIADDVFIGIGSVVIKSIKRSGRFFGVPAKPIIF
jgi:UDP-3-O-[3-hydroxymyristoyl] glucosamine N-acyltransferase